MQAALLSWPGKMPLPGHDGDGDEAQLPNLEIRWHLLVSSGLQCDPFPLRRNTMSVLATWPTCAGCDVSS
uniref:Uncharacterized protein n=1 Tax=Physcomitrium patens TaxID=3218 RepID=A0A2K1L2H2_PHYPA|nr:hypothetical protein PHYPA_003013 [Physcomitrium patens]